MSDAKRPIRWGILGPGNISTKFAIGLEATEEGALVGVASRSHVRAKQFADTFGIPLVFDSYEALAQSGEIDVVYIGTPHVFHKDHAILCMQHGKHVLCEKPLAINATEVAEMLAVAREQDVVLLEAMWSRFLPTLTRVRALLASGAIGEPRQVNADFGFRTSFDPTHRLFDAALGGGALLDVGIYPVSLACMVLGEPIRVATLANLGKTGVDEETAVLLAFPNGAMALLSAATRLTTAHEATIFGTLGWIKIHPPWWRSTSLSVKIHDGDTVEMHLPFKANGYTHEADAMMALIRAGQRETAVIPHDESLIIMKTLDEIRQQWGLRYPME